MQNKRKGIICSNTSLHSLKRPGGSGGSSRLHLQTQCSNDGFGKDSDGARLTEAGGLGGGLAEECSHYGFARDSYDMVFEASLHGLRKQVGGGGVGRVTTQCSLDGFHRESHALTQAARPKRRGVGALKRCGWIQYAFKQALHGFRHGLEDNQGQRTTGPRNQKTTGPEDHATRGPQEQRTTGPEDQRTRAPEDQRIRGPAKARATPFKGKKPEPDL